MDRAAGTLSNPLVPDPQPTPVAREAAPVEVAPRPQPAPTVPLPQQSGSVVAAEGPQTGQAVVASRAAGAVGLLDAPPLAPVARPPQARADTPATTAEDASDAEVEDAPRWERTGLEWTAIIAGALVAALLIKVFVFQAFVIPSESMETTLLIHDRVLVNKLSYHVHDIRRGDVVVFKRPDSAKDGLDDSDLIKRVIGLPGERIEGHDQQIYINGQPLAERWLPTGEVPTLFDFGPLTVPDHHIFVLGDNRDNSRDSRFIGPVDIDLVVGRAFIRWWPPGRVGGI